MLAVTVQKGQHLALQRKQPYLCFPETSAMLIHDRKHTPGALNQLWFLCYVPCSVVQCTELHDTACFASTKEYSCISLNRSSLSPIFLPSNLTVNPASKFHNRQIKPWSWSRHVINLLTSSPLTMIFGARGVEFSSRPPRKHPRIECRRCR
jgi:hypothetical protein